LKIILIGPSFPFRGGIANFNDSLYNSLVSKHEVLIIGFSLQYPSLFFPGKSQFDSGNGRTPAARRMINTINPLSWFKTANEIARLKPDCVIVHYWMPFFAPALGTITRLVKKKTGTVILGLLHNIKPHEKMTGGNRLNSYFLKGCDGVIAMSSTVLDQLAGLGIDVPARMIPHPVYDIFGEPVSRPASLERLNLDAGQRHLLFFGLIRPYKGLDLLLKAFASSRLDHLNLKLIVAGEFYGDREKYYELAETCGIKDRVMFTSGFVPEGEVRYYFGASDLVVLPYLSATQSGVTQIAFHFNKPVVVTGVGGLKEMVTHGVTGYVCEKDPDEIASAIADFFDSGKSPAFTANIENGKKRFSWDEMVKGIEALHSEILSPSPESARNKAKKEKDKENIKKDPGN
jgi:glycosyltransferase involved in cell wall biosynthesis